MDQLDPGFKPYTIRLAVILAIFLLQSGCDESSHPLDIPPGFPQPDFPSDNLPTRARIKLGEKLFHDKRLSLDSTISCISCHLPEKAFTDGRAKSIGIGGRMGKRNSPSILNAAYLNLVNKDGGVKKLDLQAIVPIEDENEMGISLLKVAERLADDPEYADMANEAYAQPLNPFVITRALASFVRTLYSGRSAYDRYLNGDTSALSPLALEGKRLFESQRLNCVACHRGFNLTDNTFENNGLYEHYEDKGRMLITADSSDLGKFRVPSLRNIAVTAPYMHDGSLPDLTSVLDHYEKSGKAPTSRQSEKIKPFQLEPQERAALIAFLFSLTDEAYEID
ncbi:MAG: c-type cytochrome [Saprospiraceae bacterium]|nr:c-type cytochrome [Saprospiraceae bacterium]